MKNLILVGGNRLNEDEPINTISELAKKNKYKIFLFTEKIHLSKKCKKKNFRFFLKKKKIEYKAIDNINSQFNSLKKKLNYNKNDIMLLTNSIWKIDKNIISFFNSRIFNIHIGKFPFQIGAGGASWLRMVNAKLSSITIHEVTEKFDSGRILVEKDFKLKKDFNLLNYYSEARKFEKIAYQLFFKAIKKKIKFKIKKKDNDTVYMPRLNTKIHGYVDWSWNAEDIVNFINAFSDPYSGASTFIRKRKFYIKNAKLKKNKIKFHPFQSGIIFNKTFKSLLVAAFDGVVEVGNIFDSRGKKVSFDSINLGRRFFTPAAYLEKARLTSSIHSSKGIINLN